MFRYARHCSIALTILLIVSFLFAFPTSSVKAAAKPKLAGASALSTQDLKTAYAEAIAGGDRVRILIVPGHEPTYGGARYAGYYERELAIMLSEKLATELRADPNLEVLVARGSSDWNRDLDRYFDRNMKAIKKFVDTHKKEFKKLVRKGKVDQNAEQAGHNVAPGDVAYRLYGITKWSNENDVDLMIHVHLNDAGDRRGDAPGAYTGLAIYVPYKGFGNAAPSKEVAKEVYDRLTEITAKSTLAIEDKGIVEDAELIALGAHNTSAVPSVLIEYGYIYEPKFIDQNVRDVVFSDYSYQTARGIADFFGGPAGGSYSTRVLPYTWSSDAVAELGGLPFASAPIEESATIIPDFSASVSLYALQHALKVEGYYPATPSTLINCPIDGRAGSCITDALNAFQAAKGITQSGTLDAATRNFLNAKYGVGPFVRAVDPVAATKPTLVTPSTSCAAFSTPLKLKSTDAATKGAVTRLQKILAEDTAIYPEGTITGYFGPATDRAVKAFQVKKGITKAGGAGYGVVGPATGKALTALCK